MTITVLGQDPLHCSSAPIPTTSAFLPNLLNLGIQLRDLLFQRRNFGRIIGLPASGIQELLQSLDLVLCCLDLLLLLFVQCHVLVF